MGGAVAARVPIILRTTTKMCLCQELTTQSDFTSKSALQTNGITKYLFKRRAQSADVENSSKSNIIVFAVENIEHHSKLKPLNKFVILLNK